MNNNTDNLKKLFESIRTISFFNRLFGWGKIKDQLIDAVADLQKLNLNTEALSETINKLESRIGSLDKDLQVKNERLDQTMQRKNEIEIDLAGLKNEIQNAQAELAEVKRQNIQLLKEEDFRREQHSHSLATLASIREQIQGDRAQEVEEQNSLEIQRIRDLKETWHRHEENVRNVLRSICQKHVVSHIEKVPFKGDPDNTLMVCDEYIIFDAKSPGGDDMKNFPGYLKDQAEKAKKYAKQENVKSDIFFVVPSNTLDYLETFVYRHGDHIVYIISLDALEPIILSLQKIEAYEYAKELSPEDRENICRVLGRFAHLSKRRIQVDSFFAKQFIELAYKCETDLPKDILESVIDFERSEKLNPPQEKRAKAISIGDLEKEIKKINREADGKGILMENDTFSTHLNELPLYKKEEE